MSLILWVDDEIDLLQPYIIYLKSKNYDIVTATNGEDAFQKVIDYYGLAVKKDSLKHIYRNHYQLAYNLIPHIDGVPLRRGT